MPKKKILILDDDELTHQIIIKLAKSEDYFFDSAYSSDDLLNLLKEEQYDILLLDLILPKGKELLSIMDEITKLSPNSKKILCTGLIDIEHFNKFKKYKIDTLLSKPFTRLDLLKILNE